MKASFNEVFGQTDSQFAFFPPIIIEQLNRELPEGVRYHELGDGDICIGPCEDSEIRIGGLEAIVTPEMREAIGSNPSTEEVLKYCYNAQEPLRMNLLNEGHIEVNGESISADRFVMNPNHQVNLVDGQFIAYPQPFPPSHELHLGVEGADVGKTLTVSRMPNRSLNVLLYESEPAEPLVIKYTLNTNGESVPELIFSMHVHTDRFHSLREAVCILQICNAAINGTMTVEGKRLGKITEGNIESIASEDLLCWLEKALVVESYLGISFDIRNIVIDRDSIRDIADIYFSCVFEKPIKTSIVDANIKLNHMNKDLAQRLLAEHSGEKIALFYQIPRNYVLFGEAISFISLHGIFDLVPSRIEDDDDSDQRLFLEKPVAGPDGYSSYLLFKDQGSLEKFCSQKKDNDIVRTLAQAGTINEYLDEEL